MTSLKLFYRSASAALLLGLIVGAPDIAQALDLVPSITGSLTGRESPQTPLPPNVYKPLPPPPPNVGKLLPPIPSSATPPQGILKAPNGRGAPVPPSERPSSVTNQTVPAPQGTPPPAFAPSSSYVPNKGSTTGTKSTAGSSGDGGPREGGFGDEVEESPL